jgi:hypothetical protein
VRNIGKREKNGEGVGSGTGEKLKDEVNDLFKLPLPEFTGARNTLSTLLKKRGLADDANFVKALAKPSISAWTVNQLYWKHREAFDSLLAAGQGFREAQGSGRAGKVADMRRSLDARREALSHLADLATSLLHDAGHNPTPDTIRRITTTLEALSAHASLSAGLTLGRLTQDVDPPGFESLASFIPDPATSTKSKEPVRVTTSQKLNTASANSQQKASSARDVRQLEKNHQARLTTTKLAQTAKKALIDARAKAQRLEAAQKKADAEAMRTAKELREAEGRLKKASAVSEAAAQRAQSLEAEAKEAVKEVEAAERAVEETSIELESLVGKLRAK